MAEVLLQVAKVVGTLSEKGWSQVHTFCPEEEEKLLSRGQFLAAVSLSQEESEDKLASQGREIITRLHEEYYGELETPVLARLKETVEKVAKESGAEITAVALVDDICYLAILGEGRLILARKDKVATVLKGKTDTNQAVTASGKIEDNDLVLLGTAEFFRFVSFKVIQIAMASKTAEEVVEILAPAVHGQDESSLMAAVVAKAIKKTQKPVLKKWSPIIFKLKSVLFFFKSYLAKLIRRGVYLKSQKSKRSRKSLLTIVLLLFLLLVVSVVFGRQQRKHRASREKITRLFEEAHFKKQEGEALIELNPVRAKELLLEAQSLVQKIETEGKSDKDFLAFREGLEKSLIQVLREHEVQPDLLFDLVLIKDSAVVTDVVINAGKLVVLDKEKQAVYQLDLVDKKSAIVAGGEEFQTASELAAFGQRIFVLTEKGILEFEKDSKKPRLVVGFDEDWGKVVDLQTFAGNLYLLTDQAIWQYLGTESGFGAPQQWLKDKIDLSGAVSMAIDGSIWVLQTSGQIVKLTRGQKDPFGVAGLDKSLNQSSVIFTDIDQKNLYILDKANLRVVVLEKSGEYHSQYLWEGIKEVDSLVVSEKEGRIFLLQGSRIYEIGIR